MHAQAGTYHPTIAIVRQVRHTPFCPAGLLTAIDSKSQAPPPFAVSLAPPYISLDS